jgi:hypothetical protein
MEQLSGLISQHVSVPSAFRRVVEWAQAPETKGVALKADTALYLSEYGGSVVLAFLVNKSAVPEAILGCTTKAPDCHWPKQKEIAQDLPARLVLDGWQRPAGLRLEPASFARIAMFFPVFPRMQEWVEADPTERRDPLSHAFGLQIETVRGPVAGGSVSLCTPEGLRRWIKQRLED